MNATNTTSEYLILFRGNDWDRSLSPAELQKTMAGFLAWFERLTAEGILKASQPLMDEGRTLTGAKGRSVADGPFAESKEAVGGYALINANDLDHAAAIAQGCPMLEHGIVLEVRPIAESCPTIQRVQKRIEEQFATAGA